MNVIKGKNLIASSQQGSLPLSLIVLLVLIVTSGALTAYIVFEINAAKNNIDAIQTRYTAEAGIEHIIYNVRKEINENAASSVWVQEYDIINDRVTWIKDDVDIGETAVYLPSLLSFLNNISSISWTSSSIENKITMGNNFTAYYLLEGSPNIINNHLADGPDPALLLPQIQNFTIPISDAFYISFTIRGVSEETSRIRTITADAGFNIQLYADSNYYENRDPITDELYSISRNYKVRTKL